MTITTNGDVFEFVILDGFTASTGAEAITIVARLVRPATLEDLKAAGFDARMPSVSEMHDAGIVPLGALSDELRTAIAAYLEAT